MISFIQIIDWLHEKLLKEGIEHRYIEREKMNHVYVGLPIKEARKDIQELIEELKNKESNARRSIAFLIRNSSLFYKL